MKRTRRSTGTRQVESKDEDKRDRKRQARGDQEEPRETGATHLWPSLQAGSSALHEPLLQQGLQQQQEHSDRHDQSQQQQQQQHEQQHRRLDASHPGRVQHVPRRRASLTRRRPGAVSAAEPERPSQPQQEHEHQQRHEPQPLQGAAPPQASMLPSTSTFEHASEPIPPMQIHVKWVSATGKTKVTELPLKMVESTNDLTGVHKRLTNRVFAERDLPDFLVSDNYLKFSTCEECLNMPLEVLSTNFKLAAFKDGWQYVVHDSRVSAPETSDNQPKLHVTIIEFDSIAHIIGHLGIRMSMVAYPLITIHKEFLLTTLHQLRTDPNFRGIFAE